MNRELYEKVLFSGIWGTCGPMENAASRRLSEAVSRLQPFLDEDQPFYSLLTYAASAARQILELYSRMTEKPVTLKTEPEPASPASNPEPASLPSQWKAQAWQADGKLVLLMDFGFAGALVTRDPELYQTFYALHHCGHRPGIGATVDLSEESILGGDMRITEWQALALLDLLSSDSST